MLRFNKKYLEIFFTLFKNFLFETMSITVFPTAIARGLPPKVDPCVPAVIPDATFLFINTAPIGNPPPIPLAMAVGNSVMDIISDKKFLNNIKRNSKYFLSNLNDIKDKYPKVIKEIRGRGFLIGIQLNTDQIKFIKRLMDNKLLTIRAAENVVRVLPPLNVKKSEIDQALKIIKKVCLEMN